MTPRLVALIKSMSDPPDMIVSFISFRLLALADDEGCASENFTLQAFYLCVYLKIRMKTDAEHHASIVQF